MTLWKIMCEENKYPGMWQRWYLNQCVGVGWHKEEGCPLIGPIRNDEFGNGWNKCRKPLQDIAIGDHIVVSLRHNRVARLGQVTGKAIEDDEWNPLVPPSKALPLGNIGRRIEVRWDMTTGPNDRDLVVVLPDGSRFNAGELRPTISAVRSISLEKLRQVMNDPANWVNLLGRFAYERALSEFIAAYPYKLEDGLLQHPSEKVREKVFGDGRRSDVLLIDRSGKSVVVECKQNAPTRADCKQLLHYLGLLHKETGADVRGILVHGGPAKLAKEVSEYAAAKSIEVVRYRLDVDFMPCI